MRQTHRPARQFALVIIGILVAATLAPIAGAAPPQPTGPNGTTTATPVPPSTPAPATTTPAPTPSGNGTEASGSGGSGNWVFNSISDGIIDAVRTLGVDQSIEATANLTTAAIELAAYTPHANNAGNWFHNPTNNAWPQLWDYHTGIGASLWAFTVGVGLLMGLGAYAFGSMTRPDFVEWRRRWLVGVGAYWAWELGNMYLWFLDGLKTALIAESLSGPELGGVISIGLVLILIVAIAWWSLAAVGLAVGIIVASIVGVEVLTPFLRVIVAARAIPFRFVHGPADKMARLWAILPALTLPMALSLSVGFSINLSASGGSSDIVAALMPALVFIGTIGFAIVSPYIVWSGASTTGAFSVGFAGGSIAMSQRYEQARDHARAATSKGRQGARGARDAARGAGGKPPVADGGRGFDAGRAVRQTGSALRGNRNDSVRSRLRRANARRSRAGGSGGPGASRRKQLINRIRDRRSQSRTADDDKP